MAQIVMTSWYLPCSWACFYFCWPVLPPPLTWTTLSPASCRVDSTGRPRGLCSQIHTPHPPWLGPSPRVSVQSLSTPSPGSCNSQRGPSQGMGPWVLSPAVSSPCKCCFGQELPCKVTSTTMYKATAAAAALPPVQRKLNLFHILINQCEFFIRVQGCFLGMRDFRKEGTRGTRLTE